MRGLMCALAVVVVSTSAATTPNDAQMVQHVLNRITYGPRDGDVERIKAMGLEKYIDRQLHPDRIPDPAMASRLDGLKSISMSTREIAATFEAPLLEARRTQQQNAKADADPDAPKMPS